MLGTGVPSCPCPAVVGMQTVTQRRSSANGLTSLLHPRAALALALSHSCTPEPQLEGCSTLRRMPRVALPMRPTTILLKIVGTKMSAPRIASLHRATASLSEFKTQWVLLPPIGAVLRRPVCSLPRNACCPALESRQRRVVKRQCGHAPRFPFKVARDGSWISKHVASSVELPAKTWTPSSRILADRLPLPLRLAVHLPLGREVLGLRTAMLTSQRVRRLCAARVGLQTHTEDTSCPHPHLFDGVRGNMCSSSVTRVQADVECRHRRAALTCTSPRRLALALRLWQAARGA